MANKIFKNEKSIFGKLENLFWTLYKKESFRFLIAGGLNTLMGMVSAILLRLVFDACGWNSKISFDKSIFVRKIPNNDGVLIFS